jgi:hypothetical protein
MNVVTLWSVIARCQKFHCVGCLQADEFITVLIMRSLCCVLQTTQRNELPVVGWIPFLTGPPPLNTLPMCILCRRRRLYVPRNTTCNVALALKSKPPPTTLRYNTTQQLLTRIPERNHFCCTTMSSFAQVSARSRDDKQLNAQMQIIDEDVEKMNFNLISVENSIRRMSAARHKTSSESYLSVLAKQAKSRNALKTVASKLLSSQKIQQEKPIRFWNKRIWEQESKKITEVAATEQLSEKTTALLIESRKKMLAKKFQLFRLSSELKNMNLESVIMCFVLSPNLSYTETQLHRLSKKLQTQI